MYYSYSKRHNFSLKHIQQRVTILTSNSTGESNSDDYFVLLINYVVVNHFVDHLINNHLIVHPPVSYLNIKIASIC